MKSGKMIALATWCLEHLTFGPDREALCGDLLEQLRGGRSTGWLWREVLIAIGIGAYRGARPTALPLAFAAGSPIGAKHPVTDEIPQPLAPITVPLLGSFLLTGIAVCVACRPPLRPSLTWESLFALAFLYVLLAAASHVFAVWSICRVLREQIEARPAPLIYGMWMSVAWLPLLTLLIREHSILVAAVPSLILTSAVLFLKRWRLSAEKQNLDPLDAGAESSLFHIQESPSLLRTLLPPALTSIAFQAGIGVLLIGHPLGAGSLFALCAVLPIWAAPTRSHAEGLDQRPRLSVRGLITNSLLVILLTGISLTPYLIKNGFTAGWSLFLRRAHIDISSSLPKIHTPSLAPGSAYSGVILLTPPKPHEKITPPPPASRTPFGGALTKPTIIPFDGAYWYFKKPDPRPKADARVVRGDPTKENIRSVDYSPLSMEAHQHLGNSISMDCCHSIRLAIRNADDRPGAIYIEILLKSTALKEVPAQSLGTFVVPSSTDRHIALNRPPVDEVLNFPLSPGTYGRQFDEITVAIKPSRERAMAGALIAVQHFELVP